MNRKSLVALAVAAAASLSAFAESPLVDAGSFASTASRAAVQAELQSFRAAGVNPWSTRYDPLANRVSTASRADVTADYIASRDRVAAVTGEDSGSTYLWSQRAQRVGQTLAGQPVSFQ
jgi:hypothetical protein